MSDIDTVTLTAALEHKVGSKHAGWVMELLTAEPDLVLAWLSETGRLTPTGFEFVPGRRGYAYSRLSSERDDVPSSTKRASDDTPADMRLWRLT